LERLGLPEHEYSLITTYYDNATAIIDELDDAGILGSTQMDYPNRPDGMPPYFLTEFDQTAGTVLGPRVDEFSGTKASNPSADTMRKLGGRQGDGADLITQLAAAARGLGIETRTQHRVNGILTNEYLETNVPDVFAAVTRPSFSTSRSACTTRWAPGTTASATAASPAPTCWATASSTTTSRCTRLACSTRVSG